MNRNKMLSAEIFGPHMAVKPMCTICRTGQASSAYHCTWCGVTFLSRTEYGDHLDTDTDHFDRILAGMKALLSVTDEQRRRSPGERNFERYLQECRQETSRRNVGTGHYPAPHQASLWDTDDQEAGWVR